MTAKIIFIGTGSLAVPVLEKLIENYKIQVVIMQPDRPVGRQRILEPSPIKKVARAHNLLIWQPENIKEKKIIARIKKLRPDLIIAADYGQIIPKELLKIPLRGLLNIHPSLLPKYRGASPLNQTILDGQIETGVTIMLMDEKMDHGPIVAQEKIKIDPVITVETLRHKLSNLGAELLLKVLPDWLAGDIKTSAQNHSQATYTQILSKADGQIDWTKKARVIERQIRAYLPWPGTWTLWDNKKLKIIEAEVRTIQNQPGKVFLTSDKKLAVGCGTDSLILKKLQREGKKVLATPDFLRGNPALLNVKLG